MEHIEETESKLFLGFIKMSDRNRIIGYTVAIMLFSGYLLNEARKTVIETKDQSYRDLKTLYDERGVENKELKQENKSLMIENTALRQPENKLLDSIIKMNIELKAELKTQKK